VDQLGGLLTRGVDGGGGPGFVFEAALGVLGDAEREAGFTSCHGSFVSYWAILT